MESRSRIQFEIKVSSLLYGTQYIVTAKIVSFLFLNSERRIDCVLILQLCFILKFFSCMYILF